MKALSLISEGGSTRNLSADLTKLVQVFLSLTVKF